MADFDPDAYLASKADSPAPSGGFDPDSYLAAKTESSGPSVADAAGRGLAQGASLGTEATVSPILERAYAQLFGDDATKARYAELSNDDLKKTYVDQNNAALQAHPGAYIGGQIAGSLPSAIATGGLASEGAGTASAAAGLGKLGGALVNGGAQAIGQGALGAVQGYNANPMASDADKLASAEKAGTTAAALAGPLSVAAPYVPVLARTVGGAALGGGLANITNPLHPSLGKTALGMVAGAGLANAAPAALDKLGIANDLSDARNFGKEGTSLVTKGDANRVQGGISDLADQVTKGIGDLDEKVSAPAIQTLQDAHQDALEQFTKDLNATPEQAQQIIQNSKDQAINKIQSLIQAADEKGVQLSTGNVVQALQGQLEQDISSSGTVIGDLDRKTVQNAIGNLNDLMVKKGVPIDIKSSTIVGADGKPFLSNLQVGGKSLSADEVKNLINPATGQLDPEAIQQLAGPNAQASNVASSVKTTQMAGNNPQGQPIPDTALPPPNGQAPLGEISPDQLQSGQAMQSVPGQAPDSSGGPMFTQVNSKQTLTPQEPLSGDMSVSETQNLKRLMGKLGYDTNSIPDEVKGRFIQANQDLNKIITGSFQPEDIVNADGTTSPAPNEYAEANAKLTAIHDLGKLVGVPTKLYSTGEQIPPAQLQNIIKAVGTSLTDADNTKFQQIVGLLGQLDPEGAQSFANNVQELSGGLANLKSAGSNPIAQQAALSEQGLATPATEQAAQNLQQVNTIKNTTGAPSSDVDAQGNPLPSSQTYKFIKSLGQAGPAEDVRSEIQPEVKAPLDNAIDLLRQHDPDLVNTLETQGKSLARQNELMENNDVNPKSLVGRTAYFIKQGLVRGANLEGQAENYAQNQAPIVSPFFRALPSMISSGSPYIAKYVPILASAYQRGNSALNATNYMLSQTDPQYRELQTDFNQRFQ